MLNVLRKVQYLLLLDFFLIIISLWGIRNFYLKPSLPFTTIQSNDAILIQQSDSKTHWSLQNATLLTINKIKFDSNEEIETYLDAFKIGDNVNLRLLRGGAGKEIPVKLVSYYSMFYVFVATITGFFFIFVPVFVVLKKGLTAQTLTYHWVMVASGLIILNTWGTYNSTLFGISFVSRFIFHIAYAFFSSVFLHFTLVFPNDIFRRRKTILFMYGFSFLLSIATLLFFGVSIAHPSTTSINNYILAFNISRYFVLICLLFGVFNFAVSYRRAKTVADKKKLKWLLFGLTIGPLTFALLWLLPLVFIGRGLIPEELLLIVLLIIPFTFSISILKYHLWDIDRVINRSVVYSILLAGIIAAYFVVVLFVSSFATKEGGTFPTVITVAVIALFVQSLKRKIETFVDKTFFRVQYDFRFAVKKVLQELSDCTNLSQLSAACINGIVHFIPVKNIAFASVERESGVCQIVSRLGTGISLKHKFWIKKDKVDRLAMKHVALQEMFEGEINSFMGDPRLFKRLGFAILLPLKNSADQIHAMLLIGERKSEQRFSYEDFDLLYQIAAETSIMYERILLQQKAILDAIEKQKLVELNELKSLFVSSVSHDLKTPLTSIKMFAELIEDSPNLTTEKKNEYLRIIQGETARLSRLIDNVLDLAKIERGTKDYHLEKTDLNDIVSSVIRMMEYQIKMNEFELVVSTSSDSLPIVADKDAIEEALINLISNSIKYSKENKKIIIITSWENSRPKVSVKDEGIGIGTQDLQKIFEPYERLNNEHVKSKSGTGIGLTVVKHIVHAHNAEIRIKSAPGEGTEFMIIFENFSSHNK